MNTTYIKRVLSSISAKLFISFWLIALLSIFTTRFISGQFTDNSLILPAHMGDLRQLHKVARLTLVNQPQTIDGFLTLIKKKYAEPQTRRPINVIIKNSDTNQISSFPKNHPGIDNYLIKNHFTDVISVEFPHTRLTGPLVITIGAHHYQLYITSKDKKRPFGFFIMQLPSWARLAIPLVISFVFCWLLARSLSKPLLKIQKVAAKLGDGDLSVRVADLENRNDELGNLAISFNQMAAKLEQNINAQQRLIGDISHELRSPMTRLQMALGLAQQTPLSKEQLTKYLQRCELEVGRLDRMIADVLVLSRLENALHTFHFEKLNIITLLDVLIEDTKFLAEKKAITITFIPDDVPVIVADSQLLASAINNVLVNAVKYSSENSKIIVKVTSDDFTINISVEDAGEGVPQESIAQLFEPFYRVTSDRQRKTGGTGLGLAIAKQAVAAHKGEIFATSNTYAGLTVTIKLPLG